MYMYRLKRATDYEKADLILDLDEMMKKWNINSIQTKKNWFLLELSDAGSYCKTGFLPASYKFNTPLRFRCRLLSQS